MLTSAQLEGSRTLTVDLRRRRTLSHRRARALLFLTIVGHVCYSLSPGVGLPTHARHLARLADTAEEVNILLELRPCTSGSIFPQVREVKMCSKHLDPAA